MPEPQEFKHFLQFSDKIERFSDKIDRFFFFFSRVMHIHISLPLLVPDAGLPGPDAGLFVYHTAWDTEALAVVVTGITGADNVLLLQADYRYAGLNI